MKLATEVVKIEQNMWAGLPINLSHAMIINNRHNSNNNNIDVEVMERKIGEVKTIIDTIQFQIGHARVFCTFDVFIFIVFIAP